MEADADCFADGLSRAEQDIYKVVKLKQHIFAALICLVFAGCGKPSEPLEQSAQIAASVQALQCGKDTDCKGDRICESGQCVSPEPTKIALLADADVANSIGTTSSAQSENAPPPKFKDYPAGPAYTGPTAKLVLDNDLANSFRTRLREGLTGQPGFASEYVGVTWGCGTSCAMTAFVNKRTGKVLELVLGGESGPYITEYRIDSKLIVAEGPVIDKDYNDTGKYAAYFYALDGGELKLIRTILIKRPDDADHNGLPDNPESE